MIYRFKPSLYGKQKFTSLLSPTIQKQVYGNVIVVFLFIIIMSRSHFLKWYSFLKNRLKITNINNTFFNSDYNITKYKFKEKHKYININKLKTHYIIYIYIYIYICIYNDTIISISSNNKLFYLLFELEITKKTSRI